MLNFQSLINNRDFVKAQSTLQNFIVSTENQARKLYLNNNLNIFTRNLTPINDNLTISKNIIEKGAKNKNIKVEKITEKNSKQKKIRKFVENLFKNEIELSQDSGFDLFNFVGKKIRNKLLNLIKRKDLKEHRENNKNPSLFDGLFAIFYPEIFVLEIQKRELKESNSKAARPISKDLKFLAMSMIKFTATSVKVCHNISSPSTLSLGNLKHKSFKSK